MPGISHQSKLFIQRPLCFAAPFPPRAAKSSETRSELAEPAPAPAAPTPLSAPASRAAAAVELTAPVFTAEGKGECDDTADASWPAARVAASLSGRPGKRSRSAATARPASSSGASTPAATLPLSGAPAAPAAAAAGGGTTEQSAPEKPGAQTQDAKEPFAFTVQAPFGELQSCTSSEAAHVVPAWHASHKRHCESAL